MKESCSFSGSGHFCWLGLGIGTRSDAFGTRILWQMSSICAAAGISAVTNVSRTSKIKIKKLEYESFPNI
jgi:hypothetical protein